MQGKIITYRCFENVAQFSYWGTTITNQSLIQEENKMRLISGNVCYLSVQNLLSSRLLSKNRKIGVYKTMFLSLVLYGFETWSLTVREGHRLRAFENRVLRRIYGPKRDELAGSWRKLHNEELRNLYSSPNRMFKWRIIWERHSTKGAKRNAYRILVKSLKKTRKTKL
jgi:hypothetical protein